jgi:hypothetical protein
VSVYECRNTAFESRTAVTPSTGLLGTTALYAVLATAYTWPLVGHLGDRVPVDGYDPLLNSWLLWWSAHSIPFTNRWWNVPFFFPLAGVLSLSETLLGLAPLTAPLQYLGASPLAAHNVAYMLSFVLCGLAMHLLVFELSGRRDLAVVAGLAFAFAPYRAAHLAHLQVLCAFWIPLVFFGLHRFLRTGRTRWLALATTAWVLQGLTNAYFFLFLTLLVVAWVAWFVVPGRRYGTLTSIALAFGATSLVPLVLFLQYTRWHAPLGFERLRGEIESQSADVLGFVSPPAALAHWAFDTGVEAESWVFPGVALPAVLAVAFFAWRRGGVEWLPARRLAVIAATTAVVAAWAAAVTAWTGPWRVTAGGLTLSLKALHKPLAVALYALLATVGSSPALRNAWRRGSIPVFYGLAAVASAILALGPTPHAASVPFWDKPPYALLIELPGFASVRSPARVAMFFAFSLICAALLGLGRLTAGSRFRRSWIALVAAGILWDGWIRPLPLAEAPVAFDLPREAPDAAAVLELPVGGERDTHAMYRGTRHGQPVVNGYSGFDPAHYIALRQGLERGEPEVLSVLRRHAPLLVLLDPRARSAPDLRSLVRAEGGRELPERSGGREAYLLTRAEADSPVRQGSRIASREVERRHTRVLCDLGSVEDLGSLEVRFGRGVSRLPPRIVAEVAEDPPHWRVVWDGPVVGLALDAALRDGRQVPVVLYTPGARGRYVSLRLFDLSMVEDVAVFRPAGR